jgi:hypothetical protein
MKSSILAAAAAFGLALAAPAHIPKRDDCGPNNSGARAQLTLVVYDILDSMVAHDPDLLLWQPNTVPLRTPIPLR